MIARNIKKVLILASNSFTGSHFVNYLLENTDVEVIGISRSPEYNPILLPYLYKKQERSKRFRFYQLDVNKDLDRVCALLEQEKPDIIVNYSAQGEVRNSWKWPEQWFETNCLSVVKLGQFLVNKPWLKRYVAVSTPEVYGATEKDLKENNSYDPSTPYAASKLAGDLFLRTLHKKYNFPVIFTRSANLYGIHQQLYRIIPRTIIYLKMGKKIQLHGNGASIRSFIHARDVADATWKAITEGKNGHVYHLAPQDEGISIKDLVKMICEMMGKDLLSSVEMVEENFGQDAQYNLDATKAREELNWKPAIELKDGIQEMIHWIDENWEEIQKQPLEYVHKV
ncbi:MAG TPA: GDP-mannose 4,6-dehydratase [Candidatus Nanoarchaeia archaeon]|nr:GDP-mannose 4,6-dehydratase [Candidatus Nanoarchaeia archaeon]